VAAAAGAIGTLAVSYAGDHLGPDITVSVTEGGSLDDYSRATASPVEPQEVSGPEQLQIAPNTGNGIAQDSVKVGKQQLRVVVTNNRPTSIVITQMRAKILLRKPMPTATLFQYGPEGRENTQIAFDLAKNDPIAVEFTSDGSTGGSYFSAMSESIERGNPVVFNIFALPGSYYYEWKLEVTAVNNGKVETLEIGDSGGRPFRVAGYAANYRYAYRLTYRERDRQWYWASTGGASCPDGPRKC